MEQEIHLRDEVLIGTTLAYCTICQKPELARIAASARGVFMKRMCPVSDTEPVKLAADATWYIERTQKPQPIEKIQKTVNSKNGCPNDCGLCNWHTVDFKLPVFSITNACNLDCPICFTHNRKDTKYYKSPEDVGKILASLFLNSKKRQVINITGGEPTLHPQLFQILEKCNSYGIERITMNSNGLIISQDEDFARKLKASKVQVVLSLDTLNPEKSKVIHGADITQQKLRTLEILEKYDIPATILSVCIKGINEEDVAEIANTYITKSFVKSVTIQNMTFTGKNGSNFSPHEHITIDEVEKLISSKGNFSTSDFFPLASYHPLCYSVAYYIVLENKILSLSKLIDKSDLSASTEGFYYMEPDSSLLKKFMDGINRLWAEGFDDSIISALKNFMKQLNEGNISEASRKKLIERHIKSIYIHPHMDADNFDLDRVCRCGDIVPDESGKMIPACSYNLIYRKTDTRFWVE